MDIELQKEKFWDWWFKHREDELEKRDFLKAAFFAGIEAAQQSVQPTLLTRCPKCNAVTGWHHPLCEDYSPESQSG